MAAHLVQFEALGHMPIDTGIERLNDGNGIEATVMIHHASWHKTCRLKFNQAKLERLQRKSVEEGKAQSGTSSTVHTHSRKGKVVLTDATCFLCNEPAGSEGLHEATTYDLDVRVRRYALKLGDTALWPSLHLGI